MKAAPPLRCVRLSDCWITRTRPLRAPEEDRRDMLTSEKRLKTLTDFNSVPPIITIISSQTHISAIWFVSLHWVYCFDSTPQLSCALTYCFRADRLQCDSLPSNITHCILYCGITRRLCGASGPEQSRVCASVSTRLTLIHPRCCQTQAHHPKATIWQTHSHPCGQTDSNGAY